MKWDATGISIVLEVSELSSEDQGKYTPLLAGLPMIQDAITQVKIYARAQEGKVDKSACFGQKRRRKGLISKLGSCKDERKSSFTTAE